jgi:type IV pilus assembly protein PilB
MDHDPDTVGGAPQHVGDLVRSELLESTSFSAIRCVEAMVTDACYARASDIHLDPSNAGTMIRMRIDGLLHEIAIIPIERHSEVIMRLKILSGLRTDEHQAAHDGRFRHELARGSRVDVRVSIVPTFYGENAVMRLLADTEDAYTLESLGFSPRNRNAIVRAMHQPHGMILATGPTGSGKTTTLYTIIKMLNSPRVSIVTIEDPIEYSIGGVNQIQVNERTSLTFASGLRSLLRQDPNIIMVGEIRDVETAGIAVNSALTGHRILSTLHTNDAATTLPRLLDMKVESYLIASTVTVAIGQRLVRRLCESCKKEYVLTNAEESSLAEAREIKGHDIGSNFFTSTGCSACNFTGYHGRVGIHEVLEMTPHIREAMLRRASSSDIHALARTHGMVPMLQDGFEKAAQGITSIDEVLRMRYE